MNRGREGCPPNSHPTKEDHRVLETLVVASQHANENEMKTYEYGNDDAS